MNEELERTLTEALDLLEGGASVETILARHPAQAAELRPFLLTAAQLATLARQPSLTAEQQSKRAFLAAAEARPARRVAAGGWLTRLLAPALAVLVVVFLGSAALVGASAGAMPGDRLYETKRLVESVRLGLAGDPERAATLRERFRQERAEEVFRLLAAGREAEVTLTGVIEDMDAVGMEREWTVAGLPVIVNEATAIEGAPAVGTLVEVRGRTRDGALWAERVAVVSGELPDAPPPTPTPAATITPAPTDDSAPMPGGPAGVASPTDAPTATATPSPTVTSSPSPTPVATRTAVPPSPTPPLPPPGDNDNDDNGNDNDDNSNDNDVDATVTPPRPPGDDDNGNDNDDNSNDNDDNSNDNDVDATVTPPRPPGDDDNGNDNDDNGNDNDDNSNDNDDNSNDNDDNDNDDNSNDNGDPATPTPPSPPGDDDNDNDDNSNDNDNDNDDNSNDNDETLTPTPPRPPGD